MIEHARKQNAAGNDVVIVEVSEGGGGNFYSPSLIRVAEIEHDSEYTKINAKNVKNDLAEYEFNYHAGRGPDSNYGQCLDAAKKDFDAATATPDKPWQAAKDAESQAKPQEKQDDRTR